MRKAAVLSVLVVVAAAATASSQGGTAASDDGCLVIDAGRGVVSVNAKGFVFGRFDQGQVDIDDPVADDGQVRVFGYQKKRPLTDTKTRYIGFGLRFRRSRHKTRARGMMRNPRAHGIACGHHGRDRSNPTGAPERAIPFTSRL